MRFWLLILFVSTTSASEIGGISELRGTGEITRADSSETLTAELDSDIFSYDDVRTGNGRMAIQFVDDSILKLTEHSKVVMINSFLTQTQVKVRWLLTWHQVQLVSLRANLE